MRLFLRRPLAVIIMVVTVALAIAACGGSGSTGPNSTSTKAATADTGGNSQVKFASCMRTHGIPDFPDSTSGATQLQSNNGSVTIDGHKLAETGAQFQTAMNKCAKYQNAGHAPKISGAELAKLRQGALAMAACMRSHGVPNFPDPTVGTGPGGRGVSVGIRVGGPKGSGNSTSSGLNPNSPAFKAANKICQPLMTKDIPGLHNGAPVTKG